MRLQVHMNMQLYLWIADVEYSIESDSLDHVMEIYFSKIMRIELLCLGARLEKGIGGKIHVFYQSNHLHLKLSSNPNSNSSLTNFYLFQQYFSREFYNQAEKIH